MNIIKRIIFFIVGLVVVLLAIVLLGPRVQYESYDNKPLEGVFELSEVQSIVNKRNENSLIKKGNDEKILWADSNRKTEYSVVYLHGFSASHEEGAPIHRNIANYLRANLFLTRLPEHGLDDTMSFINLTPKSMVEYAKEAVKIGKSIGDKVILMSCSTGGTLSAYLAANDPDIDALVMFAPNIELQDGNSKLLTKPWGLQLARRIKGGNYHTWPAPQKSRPFWYWKYRLEGLVALQSLLDNTMQDDILKEIKQPIFVAYYYQDEEKRDFTISVERIREFENTIGTPVDQKVFKAYADGSAHVLVSPLFNDDWRKIQLDVELFLSDVFDYSDEMTEEMVEEMQLSRSTNE